jgi:hypothetical protein
VEDFNPKIKYYLGEKNIEADTLSQYPINVNASTTVEELFADCYLNYPANVNQFPAQFGTIQVHQQLCAAERDPTMHEEYEFRPFDGIDLVCKQGNNGKWKIVLVGPLI